MQGGLKNYAVLEPRKALQMASYASVSQFIMTFELFVLTYPGISNFIKILQYFLKLLKNMKNKI